jgi:hypothetical protein
MFRSLADMAWAFASLIMDATSRLSARDHEFPKDPFLDDEDL